MSLPKTSSLIPDYFSHLTYLMIETNSSCNLKCSFCNRERLKAEGYREAKNLTLDEFQKLIDEFSGCPIDTVKLEGISEPMLHPEFDQMARILKKAFPNAFVIIATNLQYTVGKTRFVETLPFVDMVYLSIDGTGDIYEAARPPAKWTKLEKSLQDIENLVPTEVRNSKLHINFTLTENNYQTLDEIYELKERYDLASVRINLAQNWNEDELNNLEFGRDLLETLDRYKNDVKGVPHWDYKDCFWPFAGMIVDVYGNVRQCIINTSQRPIGNIFNTSARKIYNESLHYQHVRQNLKQGSPTHSCQNCDYKNFSTLLAKIIPQELNVTPRTFATPTNEEFAIERASGARFEFRPSHDGYVLRKSSEKSPRRLIYEFEWLAKNQHSEYIPRVSNLKISENQTSYDIEVLDNYRTFSQVAELEPIQKTQQIFKKFLSIFEKMHADAEPKTSIELAKTYIQNKVFGKLSELETLSSETAELITKDELLINGQKYSKINETLDFFRSEECLNVIAEYNQSSPHGDLTLENIMIGPAEEIRLIDPNGDNFLPDPLLDAAKVLQSIHSGYEALLKMKDVSVSDENSLSPKIDFSMDLPTGYNFLMKFFEKEFIQKLSPTERFKLSLHEAVHFARLLPYRLRANPQTFPAFYATFIQRLFESKAAWQK